MNTEVRTIKDFTEALQDTECSKITLMSNIQVLSNINIDRTICIDMKPSVEDIWSGQISSKNRNMIRKAKKTGLEYFIEYDFKSLDIFEKLYFETMRRLNADE